MIDVESQGFVPGLDQEVEVSIEVDISFCNAVGVSWESSRCLISGIVNIVFNGNVRDGEHSVVGEQIVVGNVVGDKEVCPTVVIEIPEEAEPIIVDAESSGGRNR